MTIKTAISALMLVTLAAAPSQAQSVKWVLQDFPPAQMPVDGKPGAGFRDDALRLLMSHWTDVGHRFVVANSARTWLMLSGKEEVCHIGAQRTPEREKQAYFVPFAVLPPLQLVVRNDTVAKLPLNPEGEVMLPQLLANPALKGLLIDMRSYGKGLDDVLAQRPNKDAVAMVQPGDLGKMVPQMLVAKRGDYSLEYEFVVNFQKQQNQPLLDDLTSLPIAGFSKMLTSNIVCPRSPWGLKAIKRIDAILAKTADNNGIRANVESWLSPETVKRYKTEMNAFAQRRKKLTAAAEFN